MYIVTWAADGIDTGLKTNKQIVADLHAQTKNMAYPFKQAFHGTPPGTQFWHSRLSYWPTRPWNNMDGRVTLIGDAAHPMTFREFRVFVDYNKSKKLPDSCRN